MLVIAIDAAAANRTCAVDHHPDNPLVLPISAPWSVS